MLYHQLFIEPKVYFRKIVSHQLFHSDYTATHLKSPLKWLILPMGKESVSGEASSTLLAEAR